MLQLLPYYLCSVDTSIDPVYDAFSLRDVDQLTYAYQVWDPALYDRYQQNEYTYPDVCEDYGNFINSYYTQLDEKLAEVIRENLEGTTLSDGELLEPSESNFSSAVVELINSFVSEALNKAESDAVGYVSVQLSYFMIRVGTMFILLILSRFFLLFIRFAAELLANLPFIKMFNKSGGLIYGIIKGFLVVYLILAVFSVISPLISSWGIISAIEDSTLGSKMYNNNFIVNLVIK